MFKASTAPPSEKKEANPLSFLDGRFVFDLEARIRGEIRENNRDFDSSFDDPLDDSWLLYRFRLGLAVKPVSWLKLYAQTQDAREEFSDRPDIPGVFGAEGDDVFDLRQAYVALGDAKLFPVTLTLGRQALTYGDGRLVADAKWVNVGRTFDAARVRFEARKYSAEAFVARPVQIKRHEFNDSDAADNFAGVYVSSTLFPKQTTDLYVFYRDKDDNQPDLDPTNRVNPRGTWNGPAARFATIGARIKSQAGQLHGWDYSGELAYQTGELFASDKRSRRFDLNAVALHTALGYTADEVLWKPRFGVEYNYASGDRNPSDGNSESFQNLFPQNHDKYGFIDLFSWRNLHDLRAQLNVKPLKLLALQFDYHSFWLADTHDFGYRVNGFAPLRPRTPDGRDVRTIGARNFAGREIDFTMTYPVNKNITLQAGYSHFFAGDYLRDTGPADDADFSYIMTTVIF
ncbi:MAG TPA: alginate export family protein [Chthoniobacterales bacterium]|nr:alginate export family protein [Chthoniobacterales bacterium]